MRNKKDLFILFIPVTITAVLFLLALFAPVLSTDSYNRIDLKQRLSQPTIKHPFGTDELGRDVFSRILFGGRVSLVIAFSSVAIAVIFGTIVGSIAGYFGGTIDEIISRIIDILLALPGIILAIAIIAYLGKGLSRLLFALSATAWITYSRLIRGQVLHLKEMAYVESARASGASDLRILLKHILPNTLSILLAQASLSMAGIILAESSLSFLGLGVQPPFPSWGEMLASGCDHLLDAPYLCIFPGLFIMFATYSFNFLGDTIHVLLSSGAKR